MTVVNGLGPSAVQSWCAKLILDMIDSDNIIT